MITVEVFAPEHLTEMAIQDAQAGETTDWLALGRANAAAGRALTARDGDGAILMCGGAIEVHGDYATLWAVVAAHAGPALPGLTRRVLTFIDKLPHRRIDAMVPVGFAAGKRWVELLGLREEATLSEAFVDGRDARFYRLWRGR